MITGDSYIGSNRQHRLSDQVSANTNQLHIANDMLVASNVRYSWNLSAAPHLDERPESAHPTTPMG